MPDLRGEVEALIADETAAIAALSVEDLRSCLDRKQALTTRLMAGEQAGLTEIADMLRRHEGRLAAAAAGLRASVQRIRDLRKGGAALRTYAPVGAAEQIEPAQGRLSRNA